MLLRRNLRTVFFLLLCAAPLVLWAALSLSPQRRVAVLSDPYWQHLFWDARQRQLQVALLNAGSRAEFTQISMTDISANAREGTLPAHLLDPHPRVLILSPYLSPLASTAAEQLPGTRILAWSSSGRWEETREADAGEEAAGEKATPRGGGGQPENVTLLYPDLRDAFYRAGKAEARALRTAATHRAAGKSDTPVTEQRQHGEADAGQGRVVHLYRPGGVAGKKEMEELRRGLREGGWQGTVETCKWSGEEEQSGSPEAIFSAGEEDGAPRRAPVVFLGVYSGVSAPEVLEAASEHEVAAAVLGPEMREAYPDTVRFSLELNIYPSLRRISVASVRGEPVPRREAVGGYIDWR